MNKTKTAIAISLIILGITFLHVVTNLHDFGKPTNTEMEDYYIKNAQKEVDANNVVTAILFDYRGLDTLGESVVLFTAATAIVVILGGKND